MIELGGTDNVSFNQLAALLGQIGLPGGGFGHGYGSMGDVGSTGPAVGLPHFPKGSNAVRSFIPVARVSDMLLSPGETFTGIGPHRRWNRDPIHEFQMRFPEQDAPLLQEHASDLPLCDILPICP